MKQRDVVYCSAPWTATPARAPETHGLEPHCDRCPARLSRYRAHGETRCAPCQLATRIEPTPNPCGCGCGGDCWPDYKGRGGTWIPGHQHRRGMPRDAKTSATLDPATQNQEAA